MLTLEGTYIPTLQHRLARIESAGPSSSSICCTVDVMVMHHNHQQRSEEGIYACVCVYIAVIDRITPPLREMIAIPFLSSSIRRDAQTCRWWSIMFQQCFCC